MGRPQKEIILLWGLPGSGKTTYANSLHLTKVIDIDKLAQTNSGENLYNAVIEEINKYIHNQWRFVLDGLVTTNKVAKTLFLKIHEKFALKYNLNFHIVWWSPIREICKYNDAGRRSARSMGAVNTIDTLPFEEPDANLIPFITKKRIQRRRPVSKPAWKSWADKNSIEYDKVGCFYSDSWNLGGENWNCWGDRYEVHAQTPLTDFKEFDAILLRICPNINFLQYKTLYNKSVSLHEYTSADWYSSIEKCEFKCSVEALYNALLDLELINGGDNG